jgi:cytochrome oxidase Cu insertion factor (SCO1/SenC/PrrC family)
VPTHPRSPGLVARLAGTGLALFVCGSALAACGGEAPSAPPANQGVVLNRVVPVDSVPLINEHGQATTLAADRGKYVVLAPFLTLCQDECPLVTGAFLALDQDLRAAGLSKQVVLLYVTVDPGRDTPYRLTQYAKRFGATWQLDTATPTNLARFWKFFGISYQIVPEEQPPHDDWLTGKPLTYDVDHTDGFLLIDRAGHERFVDANAPNLNGHLNAKLKGLLNPGGVNELDHPSPIAWTLADLVSDVGWLVGRSIPSGAAT